MLISRHGYYTGVIFKGYAGDHNILLANGGRYDNLTKRFGVGEPAVGFALEIENILDYLNKTDYEFKAENSRVLINYNNEDNFKDAYNLADLLRDKNYIVETFEELKSDDYIKFQGIDFKIDLNEKELKLYNIENNKETTINKEEFLKGNEQNIIDKFEEVK
jgi:ATP phosphoribosyltransferase regulatory subunit